MILELLAADIAGDLVERTSSTVRVREALELSLAPAFLLVGIGSIMNVMMQRLIWLASRIEQLFANSAQETPAFLGRLPFEVEIEWLTKRRALVRKAIKFSTGAAAVICLEIAVLFISAFIDVPIAVGVTALWVVTIILLIVGLGYFLREALIAADCPPPKDAA